MYLKTTMQFKICIFDNQVQFKIFKNHLRGADKCCPFEIFRGTERTTFPRVPRVFL